MQAPAVALPTAHPTAPATRFLPATPFARAAARRRGRPIFSSTIPAPTHPGWDPPFGAGRRLV